MPALADWQERHPHVHIDLRSLDFLSVRNTAVRGVDVLVALGWPGSVDLVQRPLAQIGLIVCASPACRRRHGLPTPARLYEQGGQRPGRAVMVNQCNAVIGAAIVAVIFACRW